MPYPMAGSPMQLFQDAVAYFNASKWDSLKPLLHGNVILDHLHTQGKSEFGHGGVMKALQASGATMPWGSVAANWDGHNAISGSANWVTVENGIEPINFTFLFTEDPTSQGNWIIHHLYSGLVSQSRRRRGDRQWEVDGS